MINSLLDLDPSLRYTIKQVLKHSWFEDPQLKEEISVLQASVELDRQNIQDENLIQVINERPQIKEMPQNEKQLPTVQDTGKKRKIPFSIPPFFAEKRIKA